MKKTLSILILLFSFFNSYSQTDKHEKKVKLYKVYQGTTTDSLLVWGSNKEIKYLKKSTLLANYPDFLWLNNQNYSTGAHTINTDTQLSTEEVQDKVGAMLNGLNENNITVTYDDAGNNIDFNVTFPVNNDNSASNELQHLSFIGGDLTLSGGNTVDLDNRYPLIADVPTNNNQLTNGANYYNSSNFGKTEIDALNINASYLGGAPASENPSGLTIVKRQAYGDINVRLVRSNYPVQTAILSTAQVVMRNNTTSDNFHRAVNKATFSNWLGFNSLIASDFVRKTGDVDETITGEKTLSDILRLTGASERKAYFLDTSTDKSLTLSTNYIKFSDAGDDTFSMLRDHFRWQGVNYYTKIKRDVATQNNNIYFPNTSGRLLVLSTSQAVPTPTTSGQIGEVRVIGSYRYECTGSSTWVRSSINTTW